MPARRSARFATRARGATCFQNNSSRDCRVTTLTAGRADHDAVDSTYAWVRLFVALIAGTVGSAGMWSYVVALPTVQADFGILRADASLPYTVVIIGFAVGGVMMGRLVDRFGIFWPAIGGTLLSATGFFAAGLAPGIWSLSAAHFVIGVGSSATF